MDTSTTPASHQNTPQVLTTRTGITTRTVLEDVYVRYSPRGAHAVAYPGAVTLGVPGRARGRWEGSEDGN
jgi:hypothetical protein